MQVQHYLTSKQPVIIFSAELSTKSFDSNKRLTEAFKRDLMQLGVPFKVIDGFYKGKGEKSFIVGKEFEGLLKDYIFQTYGQECYLILDEDRNAFLKYPERLQKIGKMHCVDRKVAERFDNYSKDSDGYYYVCY